MKRKARMRKMLREEDVEELVKQIQEEPAAQKAAPAADKTATPADKVLELQKAAGNNAVGALLQRWGGPATAMAAQQPQWPKEAQLIIEGFVLPLESYSEVANSNTSSVGEREGTTRPDTDRFKGPGEIVVVLKLGAWAADLQKAMLQGKEHKSVQVVVPAKDGKGIRWILTDVVISSYQVGSGGGKDPHVTLTLNFKKREFAQTPPPKR